MRILLTGGAGFIGFHLSQVLLNRGLDVTLVDNFNDYYTPQLKHDRIAHLQQAHPGLHWLQLDIADRDAMARLFTRQTFDVVINLAAQAGVRYSLDNPHAYVDSNLTGFMNILEGCRQQQVKHLIFASSSSVYGMNSKSPFSTQDRTDFPVSLYAATKKSNELLAYSYSHLYDIPTTGLRFFTVYGPWGRPDMAYYGFTRAILSGEPIRVYNGGHMKRDFTYVDDIVACIDRLLERLPARTPAPGSHAEAPYSLYNIGNHHPVSLLDFIAAIERACGRDAVKEMMPMQPGDVPATYADIADLVANLDYTPDTGIEDGIDRFVHWFRRYHDC